MSVQLEIRGLPELIRDLQQLPTELKDDATVIVLDAANAAKADIQAQYPVVTGNLRRGVTMTVKEIGPHGVSAEVRSHARHAWIYEHGTQARHTKLGVSRGIMPAPPAPVFIPTMMRTRRAMYGRLAGLLAQHGLNVTER